MDIESLLRKYVIEYVICEMCRSPNMNLAKDQGSRLECGTLSRDTTPQVERIVGLVFLYRVLHRDELQDWEHLLQVQK